MPTGTKSPEATEVLTRAELADRLRISEDQVDLMRKRGEIPSFRIGRLPRFLWHEVLEVLRGE